MDSALLPKASSDNKTMNIVRQHTENERKPYQLQSFEITTKSVLILTYCSRPMGSTHMRGRPLPAGSAISFYSPYKEREYKFFFWNVCALPTVKKVFPLTC